MPTTTSDEIIAALLHALREARDQLIEYDDLDYSPGHVRGGENVGLTDALEAVDAAMAMCTMEK